MLAIEVTETAVFNSGRAVEALDALHRLGVRIALDDFGTGHSSLGLLQTCPVDILKVDKSFVDHITMAGRHAVIATALIELCNGLNLVAVAEGVETAAQAEALYRLGYQYAQGFHFGRPVPAAGITSAVADAGLKHGAGAR
jgi:EAL domain-containing protein (putative c-di-GMP-specific phosphodiesterase class I)